ncbi:MAG: hypothetical protein RMJ34_07455 [candidate division WOR-3 bacterium]|nr:hypothetical protein [candidate division WOR-3 bacterium]
MEKRCDKCAYGEETRIYINQNSILQLYYCPKKKKEVCCNNSCSKFVRKTGKGKLTILKMDKLKDLIKDWLEKSKKNLKGGKNEENFKNQKIEG